MPVGLASVLSGDIIIIITVIIITISFFSVASVCVSLLSVLSRNILLIFFFIIFFSVAPVCMPDDTLWILTGHNLVLILSWMAEAPVAGEVVPTLC